MTPQVQEKIVRAVRGGNYIHIAAAVAGVHRDRVSEWMRRGAREIDRVTRDSRYRVRRDRHELEPLASGVGHQVVELFPAPSAGRDVLVLGYDLVALLGCPGPQLVDLAVGVLAGSRYAGVEGDLQRNSSTVLLRRSLCLRGAQRRAII